MAQCSFLHCFAVERVLLGLPEQISCTGATGADFGMKNRGRNSPNEASVSSIRLEFVYTCTKLRHTRLAVTIVRLFPSDVVAASVLTADHTGLTIILQTTCKY